MSEAETQFERGFLMLHIGRLDEAEALLEFALRIDPKLADAHAALGSLQIVRQKFDEAGKSLKAAVTLDPDHAMAHYYTALAIRRRAETQHLPPSTTQLETMRTELEQTVALAPHFVDAYQMLADVHVARHENLDEAFTLMRDALKRAPGRQDLLLTLAEVLTANRNSPEAARVLDRISASRTAETALKSAATELREIMKSAPEERGAFQELFPASPEPTEEQQSVELRGPVDEIPEGVVVPITGTGQPKIEGEVLQGKLVLLDCSNGLTLSVETSDRVVRFHTATPERLQFVRQTTAVGDAIACGPAPSLPVVVTYTPGNSAASIGEPLRIEFVEK